MIQLKPWQQLSAQRLTTSLNNGINAVLDASDTGTGKTYTALQVALNLGLPVLVVCPVPVVPAWTESAANLGVPVLDVVNVEKLRYGNTQWLSKKKGKPRFVWHLPPGSLIIWDEVHNASGIKTLNGEILALTKAYRHKVIMLSATAADDPLKLRAIGYLLSFHAYQLPSFYQWCRSMGCYNNPWGAPEFTKGPRRQDFLQAIHSVIFPARGVRVRIADIPDFPENTTVVEAYDLGKYTQELVNIYAEVSDEVRHPDNAENPLTQLLRARQLSEHCKVPLLKDMTNDLLDEGKSVIIFLSFREPFAQMADAFEGRASLIFGGQNATDRKKNHQAFQTNENRIAIVMIQAGGVGIDLHDTDGNFPRVSLICPTYSARELKQALGRAHRTTGKSKVVQRILFAAGTVEEQACKAVKRKLENMSLLNDGDLTEGII